MKAIVPVPTLLSLILLTNNLYSQASAPTSPSLPPITVNVIFNNTSGNQQQTVPATMTTHATTLSDMDGNSGVTGDVQLTSSTPEATTGYPNLTFNIPSQADISSGEHSSSNSFFTNIASHKKAIFFGGLVACYTVLWAYYIYYMTTITSRKSWGCWRSTMPLEELYILPREHIQHELIASICRIYNRASHEPLTGAILHRFESDITREIEILQNYESFMRFLQATRLHWLLPNQEKLHAQAQEKIKRLQFLQHIAADLMNSLQNKF